MFLQSFAWPGAVRVTLDASDVIAVLKAADQVQEAQSAEDFEFYVRRSIERGYLASIAVELESKDDLPDRTAYRVGHSIRQHLFFWR